MFFLLENVSFLTKTSEGDIYTKGNKKPAPRRERVVLTQVVCGKHRGLPIPRYL